MLETRWPSSYALSWDNVGLLVGSDEKEVERIFVTLDLTEDTLTQAIEARADMIISHHPLLFSAVKQINNRNFIGRRIISLIQSDVTYYAMHTNFDVKGMAQLNADCLNLQNTSTLLVTAEADGISEGIGRIGTLEVAQNLSTFAKFVKEQLELPQVQIYGDSDKIIRNVAVSGGSGKSMVQPAVQAKADVLVSGDIDYHTGIDAIANGIAIIDAGHYGTEYIFIAHMEQLLQKTYPDIKVTGAKVAMPFWVI